MPPEKTPDQTVSESIVASLLENGLITEDDSKTLAGKIATGKISASEWSVLLKLAVRRQES